MIIMMLWLRWCDDYGEDGDGYGNEDEEDDNDHDDCNNDNENYLHGTVQGLVMLSIVLI